MVDQKPTDYNQLHERWHGSHLPGFSNHQVRALQSETTGGLPAVISTVITQP